MPQTLKEQVEERAKELQNNSPDRVCIYNEDFIQLAKYSLSHDIRSKIDILREFNTTLSMHERIKELQHQLSALENL